MNNISWETLFGVGVVILFAALIYGMVQNKRRNRANDRITDEATEAEYDDPAHYPEKREALKKELHPS
jgi:hypothetical protein